MENTDGLHKLHTSGGTGRKSQEILGAVLSYRLYPLETSTNTSYVLTWCRGGSQVFALFLQAGGAAACVAMESARAAIWTSHNL